MTDKQEIAFWLKAKKIIRQGYGANCKTKDPENRCVSCKAKEVINWIEEHIKLIRMV